jgi:hypothetical protein
MVLMAGAGTASAAHTPARSRAEMRTVLEHLLSHWRPTNHMSHEAVVRGTGLQQLTSSNWSGYVDTKTSSTYTKITGKWKEPGISGCTSSSPLSAAVFWIGIDGISSSDPTVEQDGSGVICGGGGATEYFTWWELFPSNNIQFIGTTVKPGDSISSSVVRSGTKYTFKVTDSTTAGNNVSATDTCAASTCKNTSAEWIAEAPSTSSGEVTLPNFHTWTATSATVKAGSKSGTIKTFPHDSINMNDTSPHNVAKPGALNSAGNAFTDKWIA